MLVLFETSAGYALFKVLDEDRIQKVSDIIQAFSDSETASEVQFSIHSISDILSVELQAFRKFKDTKEALVATDKLINGMIPKSLEKFLSKHIISKEVQDQLIGITVHYELLNSQSLIRSSEISLIQTLVLSVSKIRSLTNFTEESDLK